MPTSVIVTTDFIKLAKAVARMDGLADLPIIEIPHPVGGVQREILEHRVNNCIENITIALTRDVSVSNKATSEKVLVKPEPKNLIFKADSNTKALQEIDNKFYSELWTDGFPIIPPTKEAVGWMLTGTDRNPDEVVGIVAPGNGIATVRNIAINAVMAGAEPVFMPAIIAAVEAITDPEFASDGVSLWGIAGMQTTTGPMAPLLIINGPIAKDIGVASGAGCFSRGHKANATIGRALRLVLTNAGRSYVGMNDMKCQGGSHEFTFCVAEREDHPVFQNSKNSWQPLHVEKGYPVDSSVITALACWPPICVEDGEHCSREILNAVVDTMSTLGQVPYVLSWEYVLVLGATHARCLAEAGLSKNDIRNYIYANAVIPWGKYKMQYPGVQGMQPQWMKHTSKDNTSIHIIESPKNISVIVAGGECMYSQIIRGSFKSTSKQIKIPGNWAELIAKR